MNTTALIRQAIRLAREGRKAEARDIFLGIVEEEPRNELAWMWLAGLVDSLEDRITACENVLTINPSNQKAIAYLENLKRRMVLENRPVKMDKKETVPGRTVGDPLEHARFLEQEGKLDEALMIYKVEAAKAGSTQKFSEIYKKIVHIEGLQIDKIRYFSPRAAIIRLTLPWPLLYLSLALVQVGLRPLSDPTSYLWFAFPWVVLGGYLIAVSEVRSRHVIWKRLFFQDGDGTLYARLTVGVVGWLMVLVPTILIVVDSLNRLSDFQIPARLF